MEENRTPEKEKGLTAIEREAVIKCLILKNNFSQEQHSLHRKLSLVVKKAQRTLQDLQNAGLDVMTIGVSYVKATSVAGLTEEQSSELLKNHGLVLDWYGVEGQARIPRIKYISAE